MSSGKVITMESGERINVEALKTWEKLSYLMLPILNELQEAYERDVVLHESWKHACIDEIVYYLDTLERLIGSTEEIFVYFDVMRKNTYLVDLDIWIKTIEILIYEQEQFNHTINV